MVRKIKAKLVLQLRAEGLSGRAIAASQQISRNSVAAVLEAADAAKLGWDDVADLPDGEVYSLLFPGRGEHESVFAEPDWAEVHREIPIRQTEVRHPGWLVERLGREEKENPA
ncbi:transposase of ISAar36, IS21 family, istA [Dietzia sp. DQ12-45-1b]|nr:transposase of ISAar36, IS21 family, istA [Dietzia sp. DQ12-45-1b]